jgi:primosomal protein N' (replication factor Y)
MNYYEVAPLKVVRGSNHTYTYRSQVELTVGQLVMIPLGRETHIGLVVADAIKPAYDTKPITSVLDITPLPAQLVETAIWMSDYYATHLAQALQTVLPRGLTKKRRTPPDAMRASPSRDRTHFLLNKHQSAALASLANSKSGTVLLHGITGSGKTAVYIEYIKQVVASGKSAIVLVPEIALTSQVVAEFNSHFTNVILTHSRQTEAERHRAWLAALNAHKPTVVIGPRSALFMPLARVGCIVIDEAHEPSYKQEQSPRYSALRVASILAARHQAVVVQGSATPLVSEYYLATQHTRPILQLPTRARSAARQPDIHVIDATTRTSFTTHRFISNELIAAMKQTLESGHQVLIFHNRRGSAISTLCESCGWMAMCPRCIVPLTLHGDLHQLQCHVCGLRERVPTSCPHCSATDIIHKGIGTKLIESELCKLFPMYLTARFDGDTASNETLERQYQDLYDGKIRIIIGTQVVAKGLDLPHLRTVGVIQADAGLSLPDFAAPERTFQLLAQVIGRVGRSAHATNIIIQTYQPSADAIRMGVAQDYLAFYTATLATRRQSAFPPFVHLLKLTCSYKTEAAAVRNAQQLARQIRQDHPDVQVLGPTPAFYEQLRDQYRWQLIIKSSSRANLTAICRELPGNYWQFDLDPYSLL